MEFNDLIGVPFVDGGRSPDTGLDCWGLALEIYRRAGVALPDFKISAMDAATITAELSANEGEWKKLPAPAVMSLVVMRLSGDGWANHVGVYIGGGRFIHAYRNTGVCIDRLRHWQSRIAGFYVPGWTV